MPRKTLEQCQTGKDLPDLVRRNDQYANERVRGSHYIVYSKDGQSVVIPVHANRDLGTGIRRAIARRIREINLG